MPYDLVFVWFRGEKIDFDGYKLEIFSNVLQMAVLSGVQT
jgi:hypothetical protein